MSKQQQIQIQFKLNDVRQVQFLGHVLRHLIGRVFSMLYALQVLCRKAADVVAVVHVEAPVVDDLGVGVLADKQEVRVALQFVIAHFGCTKFQQGAAESLAALWKGACRHHLASEERAWKSWGGIEVVKEGKLLCLHVSGMMSVSAKVRLFLQNSAIAPGFVGVLERKVVPLHPE